MKVLVLSNLYPPDFIGGYELGCRQVVDALRNNGHDVRVLTSAPRTPVPHVPHVRRSLRLSNIWDQYSGHRSTQVSRDLAEAEALQINAFNVHSLIAELEEFQPDVVYLWMLSGIGGLGLAGCVRYLGIPWVWHLMDDVPLQLCRRGGTLLPGLASEFERQFQGSYLACSQRVVDEIQAAGIHLGDDVEILQNWVTGQIPPRESSYLPGGELRVVYAGQIAPHKGVNLLIEAARSLRESGYERFRIDLYGNNEGTEFSNMLQRYDLAEHVSFPGVRTQSELMDLWGEYDVFAFPTNEREPFGFAPLEAAARGCVPLISDVCGIAEWMVHGVHCLKTPRTSEGLANAFRQILDGRIDLSSLGRRGASMVLRDFHLDRVIDRIEATLSRASTIAVTPLGNADEAYRLALLAEKLTRVIVQEPYLAA